MCVHVVRVVSVNDGVKMAVKEKREIENGREKIREEGGDVHVHIWQKTKELHYCQ